MHAIACNPFHAALEAVARREDETISAQQTRRHETANAVMSTLASPSLGGAELSLWRVAMTAGQRGPEHTFDTEQV